MRWRESVKRYWYEKEIEMREERGTERGEEGVRKVEIQSEERLHFYKEP